MSFLKNYIGAHTVQPRFIEDVRAWIYRKKEGIQLSVDFINDCVLRCPSCPIGSTGVTRGGAKMPIDLYRKILDKAQSEFKIHHVQLYSFSDACIIPDLHLYVEETSRRGLGGYISTTLQRSKCDFRKVIEARPAEFRISFPGWSKMSYYQKGAKPKEFDQRFKEVCALPRYPETVWTMAFHYYKDNADELPRVRELAKEHGLKLTAIPAIFMVPEKIVEKRYTEKDLELISHLFETPEESIAGMKNQHPRCQCWDQITLDANGDVYLCQLVYEQRFLIGMNFLEHPFKEIQKILWSHPFCAKCMAAGIGAYNECYSDFTLSDDPIGEVDRMHNKPPIA